MHHSRYQQPSKEEISKALKDEADLRHPPPDFEMIRNQFYPMQERERKSRLS